MSWWWLLPACTTLTSVVVLSAALRRVAREAAELRHSLATWDRMAVAIGDLTHEARAAERGLRRLGRR